jgi:hypothetical protein
MQMASAVAESGFSACERLVVTGESHLQRAFRNYLESCLLGNLASGGGGPVPAANPDRKVRQMIVNPPSA